MVPVVLQAESFHHTEAQLKMERLYQDVVYQEILLLEAQTRCDQERYFRIMAEALVGTLTSKVELQQQELSAIESRITECRSCSSKASVEEGLSRPVPPNADKDSFVT
ncbi:hypothetical protein WJX82_000285 [Trebouxia sp. C0006]